MTVVNSLKHVRMIFAAFSFYFLLVLPNAGILILCGPSKSHAVAEEMNISPNGEAHAATSDQEKGRKQGKFRKRRREFLNGQYELIKVIPHDSTAFTQGLTLHHGKLYESTGMYGESQVRQLDRSNGNVIQSYDLPSKYFGEGMTYLPPTDTLVQLTWKRRMGFVYNTSTFDLLESFEYETTTNEGWGITYDTKKDVLYVSDGSSTLHVWESKYPFKEIKTMTVSDEEIGPISQINELEYIPQTNTILANVWYKNAILEIDPLDGNVMNIYDLTELYPPRNRSMNDDCLNGISVVTDDDEKATFDADGGIEVYVTGKLWPNMYHIKLVKDDE
eukprot:CAMPEP_0194376360 /NCGR_PEP_ID=MMETSP0174-20130528/24753_1 /TAXON_ID=216777 /ORGANISM="Proboscia alata, Strain PI-D3" /LENGTH=331 /DNA_ID=CAMNT_0039156961 /DNA_START=54 /DNA_END=1049 /DNA_ORIENTATION=-